MSQNKMIILTGAPAVGKSTLARDLVHKHAPAVIVNRDDIRSMLGDYWIPTREPLVTQIEDHMVITALTSQYTVIVDATNLNQKVLKKWHRYAADLHVPVETINLTLPRWKAKWRDFIRKAKGGRGVGSKVIDRFYNNYKL